MTWKRFTKAINLQSKGTIFGKSSFYFSSVGHLTKSPMPEILLLSYDEKLSIFNNIGKPITQLPFSSDICSIFLKDIYANGENVFVSFSYSGEVRVFSQDGAVLWKTTLPAGINAGIVGNLDYDSGLELVALLADHRIFVLDNQGQIMAKYQHPKDILFVDVGILNTSQKKVIFFVDQDDQVNVLDIEKSVQSLPKKITPIQAFSVITLFNKSLIVIGDDSHTLHLLDKKGNVIEKYRCKAGIQSIGVGPLFNPDCESIVVVLENNYVEIINVEVKNPNEFIDTQEKMAPVSATVKPVPKSATLDFNPKVYHSFPNASATTTGKSGIEVVKNVIKDQPKERSNLRCPECGDYLAPMLIQKIMAQKDAYCEDCGRPLARKDFQF